MTQECASTSMNDQACVSVQGSDQIIVAGNVGNKKTQGRTVYMAEGISPTLCSGMDHGNTMPYIIEKKGLTR